MLTINEMKDTVAHLDHFTLMLKEDVKVANVSLIVNISKCDLSTNLNHSNRAVMMILGSIFLHYKFYNSHKSHKSHIPAGTRVQNVETHKGIVPTNI